MPAKKKESTEPTRRSTRVVSTASVATKPSAVAPKKRPIEKPAKEVKETPAKKAKIGLGVGDKLPDVTLQDEDGNDINIVDIASEKGIILFAYPKASTPGCTKQV
jgi:thioredoxin-dependent peroxiredoxin